MKSVIDEQIASRQERFDEREIQVTLECPAIQIHADRSRLATALSNLIDNAIHYNKQRGEIRISAEVQNGTVRLSVTDTG